MIRGSAGIWQVLLFLCLWMPNSCGRQLQRVNIGVLTTQGDQDSPFDAVLAGRLHVRVAQLPSMSQNPLLFLNAMRGPHNYTQEHLDVVATDLSVYSTPVQRFLLQQLAAPILIYPAPLSSSSEDHVTGQLRGSGGPSPSLSPKGSAWEACVGLRPSSFSNSELPRIPPRHEVVESVIRAINSSHVIIIFDNEAENEASYISACLANAGTLTRMVNVQRKVNLTSVFEYAAVQQKEKAQFLVLCSSPRVYRIIGLANAFDGPSMRSHALSRLSRWLLVLPPGHQTALETSSLVLDNVAVVTYPPEMQHHQEPLLQGLKLATKKIFAVLGKLQLPLSNKFLASEFVDRLFEVINSFTSP